MSDLQVILARFVRLLFEIETHTVVQFLRKAKIYQLDVALCVQENILGL